MGTYYVYCNHETKEYIEPGNVNDGAIKFPAIMWGEAWKLALFATSYMWEGECFTPTPKTSYRKKWDCVTVIGDGQPGYYTVVETYEDVTEELIIRFNKMIEGDNIPPLIYTP